MGVCASSCNNVKRSKTTTTTTTTTTSCDIDVHKVWTSESFRRPSSIMVMNISNGAIKEYKKPILASAVVSENNNCYVSNAETMRTGMCMPRVPDEDVLLPGRIYFIVPLSYFNYPLTLQFLCDLAVKVSFALAKEH